GLTFSWRIKCLDFRQSNLSRGAQFAQAAAKSCHAWLHNDCSGKTGLGAGVGHWQGSSVARVALLQRPHAPGAGDSIQDTHKNILRFSADLKNLKNSLNHLHSSWVY